MTISLDAGWDEAPLDAGPRKTAYHEVFLSEAAGGRLIQHARE